MKIKSRNQKFNNAVINQINVVPYIDVMLVLLIIFMISTPLFTPGIVNLPKVSNANQIINTPIQIIINNNSSYTITYDKYSFNTKQAQELIEQIKNIANNKNSTKDNTDNTNQEISTNQELPIVISADKTIIYDKVMQLVNNLYLAGFKKVSLVVKQH